MTQTRVYAGALIVAVGALLAGAGSVRVVSGRRSQSHDPYGVELAQQRLAAAQSILPRTGIIGYISDLSTGDSGGTAAFLAAQYALAPRLLSPVKDDGPEWAIGNFSRPQDFLAKGARSGYSLHQDLGNGVLIYRRVKR
jgi:hypothetical protein